MAMNTPRSVETPIEPNFTWTTALGGRVALVGAEIASVANAPTAAVAAGGPAGAGVAAGALAGAAQAARRSTPPNRLQRPAITVARIRALLLTCSRGGGPAPPAGGGRRASPRPGRGGAAPR